MGQSWQFQSGTLPRAKDRFRFRKGPFSACMDCYGSGKRENKGITPIACASLGTIGCWHVLNRAQGASPERCLYFRKPPLPQPMLPIMPMLPKAPHLTPPLRSPGSTLQRCPTSMAAASCSPKSSSGVALAAGGTYSRPSELQMGGWWTDSMWGCRVVLGFHDLMVHPRMRACLCTHAMHASPRTSTTPASTPLQRCSDTPTCLNPCQLIMPLLTHAPAPPARCLYNVSCQVPLQRHPPALTASSFSSVHVGS